MRKALVAFSEKLSEEMVHGICLVELIRRYDTLVPVLCLGDTEICHYFFDESALIAALPLA